LPRDASVSPPFQHSRSGSCDDRTRAFLKDTTITSQQLAAQFFLQLACILVACRIVGRLTRPIGEPQVVAEMIAGVLLGPSLLGLAAPHIHARLFPPESLENLFAASQLGLVLYMFLVGATLRYDIVRNNFRSAISISLGGILLPFALGAAFAVPLVRDGRFFAPGVSSWHSMIYLGASMSITAFPMLARIIYERGLSGTTLGTVALSAGAADDVAAWCVLAVVLASFQADASIAVLAIGGGMLYAFVVLLMVRPAVARLAAEVERSEGLSVSTLALVLVLLMFGAWFTDAIGLYAVFGAFIMGAAMPRGRFVGELERRIEPLTTTLLLPLFFVHSGLNTRMTLLDTPWMWTVALTALALASLGKGFGCWAAARLTGHSNHDALAIGTLMNARGLMELIILNIGLQRGLITPSLFTVMVLMAVVTTLAAGPLFQWVFERKLKDRDVPVPPAGE